jgi:hypothetical protein
MANRRDPLQEEFTFPYIHVISLMIVRWQTDPFLLCHLEAPVYELHENHFGTRAFKW